MLGTYTAQSYGESSNSNIKNDKYSSSMSLISRKTLTGDEVMKIEHPYAIVSIPGKSPALTTIPDISNMHFNKLNEMGDREQNQLLRIKREQERKERPIKPIKIWDIWNKTDDEEKTQVELIQDKLKRNIKENNEKDI